MSTALSRILLTCVGLATSPLWLSAQGWNTNAWPSVTHPRGGAAQADDIIAAMTNRSLIIPTATPYRTQQARLDTLKLKLGRSVDSWLAVTNSATMLADLNSTDGLNDWTATGVCSYVQIPTNFFEFTPHRGLAGCGGLVYDIATVGYPHGTTNAYTIDGGTNYPAGRTNWYTTDYGWQGMKDVLSQLNFKQKTAQWDDRDIAVSVVRSGVDLAWSVAKTEAENYPWPWITDSGLSAPKKYTSGEIGIDNFYRATIEAEPNYLVTGSYGFDTGTVDNVWGFAYASSYGGTNEPFDAYGTAFQSNQWAEVAATVDWTWDAIVGEWYVYVSDTNMASFTWCDQPSLGTSAYRGFVLSDKTVVYEFKYGGYK